MDILKDCSGSGLASCVYDLYNSVLLKLLGLMIYYCHLEILTTIFFFKGAINFYFALGSADCGAYPAWI